MKLSPQARKAIMRNDPSAQMKAMVELAPGKTPDDLAMRDTGTGGPELLSWILGTREYGHHLHQMHKIAYCQEYL